MKHVFFLALALFTTLLFAKEVNVHKHTYPTTESAYETEWNLQGTYHFKYKIFFSVFTGAYYQPENQKGERLVFTYTRNITADDLRAQAMKHLQNTQSDEIMEKYKTDLEKIQAAYEDVSDGDSYALTVLPEKGIWLARNGETVFTSEDPNFGDWYLDIWLGNPPIDKGLKKALVNK